MFDFTPSLGDTFDLVSITNAGVNFRGSFANVAFSGLSPDLEAQWEIIPSTASSGEVLRVSIIAGAEVPKPMTVARCWYSSGQPPVCASIAVVAELFADQL